jgi:hypothetical protein
MKTSDCIRAAKNDLVNARLYLEYGEAINWVTGNIISAMNWAMECWLFSKGHKISHGRGWESTLEAFLKDGSLGYRENRSPAIGGVVFSWAFRRDQWSENHSRG